MSNWLSMVKALDRILDNCGCGSQKWKQWERMEHCSICRTAFDARDHAQDFAAEERAEDERRADVDREARAQAVREIAGAA